MVNPDEIFSKGFKLWSDQDKEVVENFFMGNEFFMKFYQNKRLMQIARMCFYRRLESGEKLILQNNNRAEAIVLLTGEIIVNKKERKIKKKGKMLEGKEDKSHQNNKKQQNEANPFSYSQQQFQYIFLSHLTSSTPTLTLNSQCQVQNPTPSHTSLLFVPCALYNQLQEQIQIQRVQKIETVLEKYFFRLKKKQLHELSQMNCIFREFKMNSYIYRATERPEEVFVLLQGMVKLEKPGFSQKTLKENVLVNAGMIFGEKDIKLEERVANAIACTSHVELLTIPKAAFLKYALTAFPDMVFDSQKPSPTKLPKLGQSLRMSHSLKVSPAKNSLFPIIKRHNHFHESSLQVQHKKSQSQQKREYDLIRNSHILLDFNQKKPKKFQLRKFSPKSTQEVQMLLKNQKQKLKQLKIQSRFSLNNSLLNL